MFWHLQNEGSFRKSLTFPISEKNFDRNLVFVLKTFKFLIVFFVIS